MVEIVYVQDVFAMMPMSAIVSDRILCMHGGLSPQLLSADSIDILNKIVRPVPVGDNYLQETAVSQCGGVRSRDS